MDPSPEYPAPADRQQWPRLALTALGLALAVALMAMLAGLGARWGLWHFRTGFGILRWSAYAAVAVAILSIVSAGLALRERNRRGFPLAVVALLISLVVLYVPWSWRQTARSVPPIHDITTDTENPPEFQAVVPLRADAPNPVEYEGPEIAVQQRRAYPEIRPLILDEPADRAFQRAYQTARDMGWEVVDANASEGRIEATDRTLWFGFRDDVVIRLTPIGRRTVVDVRSLSRVGGSDVGTNAKRIRAYLRALQS